MNKDEWHSGFSWNQKGYINVDSCHNILNHIITNDLYGYRKMNFENCLLDTTGTGLLTIVSKEEYYEGIVWDWHLCTHDSCNIGTGYEPCDYTHNPPICLDRDTIPFNYTTSMLRSTTKYKYGYFEMRCKISNPTPPMTNTGIGPNFWLWDTDTAVSWSEIDIFEFKGTVNEFTAAIHYEDQYDTTHGVPTNPGRIPVDFIDFHIFAMNWTPEKVAFYLDDSLFHTAFAHASEFIPMPIYIDVNFPLHTLCQLIDTLHTQLPHYFEIDYVRVYQLKYDCNSNYLICDYNDIDYKHYNTIYVGNTNCAVTVPQNKKLYLIYNDRIKLSPNFILEDGAEIYFERIPCFESVKIKNNFEIPAPAPPSFYQRQNPIYHVF